MQELRQIREEYAAKFNYDLAAMFLDLKEQEEKSGRALILPPPKEEYLEAAILSMDKLFVWNVLTAITSALRHPGIANTGGYSRQKPEMAS